jgi:hypothetical protein
MSHYRRLIPCSDCVQTHADVSLYAHSAMRATPSFKGRFPAIKMSQKMVSSRAKDFSSSLFKWDSRRLISEPLL